MTEVWPVPVPEVIPTKDLKALFQFQFQSKLNIPNRKMYPPNRKINYSEWKEVNFPIQVKIYPMATLVQSQKLYPVAEQIKKSAIFRKIWWGI